MADSSFCSVLLPSGLWSSDSLFSLCLRGLREEQRLVDTHTGRYLTHSYRHHGAEGTNPAARLGQPGGQNTRGASNTARETLRALPLKEDPSGEALREDTIKPLRKALGRIRTKSWAKEEEYVIWRMSRIKKQRRYGPLASAATSISSDLPSATAASLLGFSSLLLAWASESIGNSLSVYLLGHSSPRLQRTISSGLSALWQSSLLGRGSRLMFPRSASGELFEEGEKKGQLEQEMKFREELKTLITLDNSNSACELFEEILQKRRINP